MLQPMGSQRIGHDLVTEQQQILFTRNNSLDHCSMGKKLGGTLLYFNFPHILKYSDFSFCCGGYGDFLFVWKHVQAY